MTKKIDHVAIAVRDFEKTIEFYTKHLGFKVIYWAEDRPNDPKKLAFLQLGDSLLEIDSVNYQKW